MRVKYTCMKHGSNYLLQVCMRARVLCT